MKNYLKHNFGWTFKKRRQLKTPFTKDHLLPTHFHEAIENWFETHSTEFQDDFLKSELLELVDHRQHSDKFRIDKMARNCGMEKVMLST